MNETTRAFGVSRPEFPEFSDPKSEDLVFKLQKVERVAGMDKRFKKQAVKSL